MQFLVRKGALINPQNTEPSPALIAAFKNGADECARYLLAHRANADPLMLLAAQGPGSEIKKALETRQPGFSQLTLLCEIAAVNGHRDIFANLYEAIRAVNDHETWTIGEGVVAKTIALGHRDVIEEMIKRDPELIHHGVTRFCQAAAKTKGMRAWLQTRGIQVPEYSDNERLIGATERDDLPEMERLIGSGADINYSGESGWTPLTKAAAWGRAKAVKLLLDHKANPNSVKSPGWNYSALCLAKTPEIADLLLAAGADVNARLYGRDVHILSYCVSCGSKEMVQWFIDHGVNPAKVKCDEPTLLFSANGPDIAEMLIDHGVDLNATDKQGRTALFGLEEINRHPAKVVAVLLKHGAEADIRDHSGCTPLMFAPDGATVDVLIAAGANPKATNDMGTSVVAYRSPAGSDSSRMEALRRHGITLSAEENSAQLRNKESFARGRSRRRMAHRSRMGAPWFMSIRRKAAARFERASALRQMVVLRYGFRLMQPAPRSQRSRRAVQH